MLNSIHPFVEVLIVVGVFALIATIAAYRMREKAKPSRTGIIVSVLPNLIMLGLFYSLALHMYHSLGTWPESIGDRGFPPLLVAHDYIENRSFALLLLFNIFVLPVAIILCLLVRPWRKLVIYLAAYTSSYGISLGIMLLAPAKFLDWWLD
jgi:predicted permease